MRAQRNLIIKISLLWAITFLAVLFVYVFLTGKDTEYTSDDDFWVRSDGKTVVSDNTFGFGTVYLLDDAGKTEEINMTRGKTQISGWQIAAIAAASESEDVENDNFFAVFTSVAADDHHLIFRAGKFTDKLKLASLSPSYRLHLDGKVTGLSAADGMLYVTEIHAGGQTASVYELDQGELLDITVGTASKNDEEALAADPADIDSITSAHSGDQDIFADAEYIYGKLEVRPSLEALSDPFEEHPEVKQLFDTKSLGVQERFAARSISLILIFGILLGGVFIIALFVIALYGRRRIAYRIAVFELILFALIAGSMVSITAIEANLKRDQFLRYETYALRNFGLYQIPNAGSDDFYGSNDYRMVVSDMEALIEDGEDPEHHVVDVCVVDIETGEIIADANHLERQGVDFVYGNDALLAVQANDTRDLSVRADEYPSTAVSQSISGTDSYRVVGILSHAGMAGIFLGTGQARMWTTGSLFIILSIAGTIFLMLEDRDIVMLTNALESLATGDMEYEKPRRVFGWDMDRMWNSIHEIEKNIREVSHIRFLTYQAYFRFAPKGIERILHKESILEVKSGDTFRFPATIAYLSTVGQHGDGQDEIMRRNAYLQFLEKHCVQEDGIYISGDSDLSLMRILFLDDSHQSVQFGNDLLVDMAANMKHVAGESSTVLLHHTHFIYGVVGSEEQAATFLLSREAKELHEYVDWFRGLALKVVLTEAVKEREQLTGVRYIGFVVIQKEEGGTGRMNIYEALDAEEFEVRQGKKRFARDFEKAMKLFYAQDFYYARNAFAAIIREVPKDMVAKWYLFECERYLNEDTDEKFIGELHR